MWRTHSLGGVSFDMSSTLWIPWHHFLGKLICQTGGPAGWLWHGPVLLYFKVCGYVPHAPPFSLFTSVPLVCACLCVSDRPAVCLGTAPGFRQVNVPHVVGKTGGWEVMTWTCYGRSEFIFRIVFLCWSFVTETLHDIESDRARSFGKITCCSTLRN